MRIFGVGKEDDDGDEGGGEVKSNVMMVTIFSMIIFEER